MKFCRIIIFFFILTIMTGFQFGAVQAELWERTFVGRSAREVQQTSDGGYVIVTRDLDLIKTDASGYMVWKKTYGGKTRGYSVKQTADGGYIFAGSTESAGSPSADGVKEYIYIVKTDSDGNEEWSKIFAYPVLEPETGGHSFRYYATFIDHTVDGGYIIVGFYVDSLHEDGIFLIKVDSAGNIQFNKSWDESMGKEAAAVKQTLDGGYIIAGNTGRDLLLLKTDSAGNAEWRKTFGGSGSEKGTYVLQTSDGDYVVGGTTWSIDLGASTPPNIYLVKTNSSGEMDWQKIFGGNSFELEGSFCATKDGGFVIGGSTASFGWGSLDAYIIKIDPSGNEQWSITIGGKYYEAIGSIQQTSDGGYVVAGTKVDSQSIIIYPTTARTFETYLAYYYPEITPVPGAVEEFVKRFYQVFFNREPKRIGLNGWVSDLSNGTLSGMDIAYGFAFSSEFVEKNTNNQEYLEILYKAFLDRDPDPVGFDGWLNALISGTDREQVIKGFIFSQEFADLCEEYGIIAYKTDKPRVPEDFTREFVTRLYTICFKRNPDSLGLQGWMDDLINHVKTGADVVKGFILSEEFSERVIFSKPYYLEILYNVVFGRKPDPPGLDSWLAELRNGRSREEVLDGFVYSNEFSELCENYGIIPH